MKHRIVVLGCAALLALATAAVTHAQQYVYSVNYECGFQSSADGSEGYEPVAKVANYAVKLDFFNPGTGDANLTGSVHETSSAHWNVQAGSSSLTAGQLGGGGASVIDCTDIFNVLGAGGGNPNPGKPFLTGMLTIRSDLPLVVWATKTTEVCSGLLRIDQAAHDNPDIIIFDENGDPIPQGFPLPPAAPALLGCPPGFAFDLRYGGGGPSGPFSGPGGSVPPGLRSRQVMQPVGSDFIADAWNVSHAIDFERVEPLVLP